MTRPVDVRNSLSTHEFVERYVHANKPVIVSDAMEEWPARHWTPEQLRPVFGNNVIELTTDGIDVVERTSYAQYLHHLEDAADDDGPEDGSIDHLRYLRAREKGVFDRIKGEWTRPYFMPPTWYCAPLSLRRYDPSKKRCLGFNLYVSPRGAASKLHVDGQRTNSMLCQVYGSKAVFLCPPDQEPLLPDRRAREAYRARHLSVARPDFGQARVLELELHAGETLFIPNSWFHEVHTLSTSISLSFNFIHGVEARMYVPWLVQTLLFDRDRLGVG